MLCCSTGGVDSMVVPSSPTHSITWDWCQGEQGVPAQGTCAAVGLSCCCKCGQCYIHCSPLYSRAHSKIMKSPPPLHKPLWRVLYNAHVTQLHVFAKSNCLNEASQGLPSELSASRMLLIHRAKARGQELLGDGPCC